MTPSDADTPLTPTERFWLKVDRRGPAQCWEWRGTTAANGYGRFSITRRRFAYELAKGVIPTGLVLDHLCRNRRCVNPDHLEAVTEQENMRRGIGWPAINARKTHCPLGHEYTSENTMLSRRKRKCRQCAKRWRTPVTSLERTA